MSFHREYAMKVLVVMGSPRKGNTWKAAKKIEGYMQALGAVEFEYLMLKDADLSQCTGCLVCFGWGEENCPRKDDAPAIEQKMHEADGVIFATPVYGINVSGLFKVFIDRFSYVFHRPRFFSKKALLLTTAGVIGTKDVLDYLDLVARIWGFEVAARAGLITAFGSLPPDREEKNDAILKRAAGAFYTSLSSGRVRSPGLQQVLVFHGQRASFRELPEESPTDFEYWSENGWLDRGRKYYIDVPVNPVYHAIGWVMERIVGRQVRKSKVERW
jgi:multimeric flavodoxin WrbA